MKVLMLTLAPFHRRHKAAIQFCLILTAASLACNTITGGSGSTQIPQEDTVHENIEYGSGPYVLADARAGLTDLTSYKATLTISFDGTRDGNLEKWSKTFIMLTSKEPAARQLTIETAGDPNAASSRLMLEMNGMDYEKAGQAECFAELIQQGRSLGDRLEPAGLLNFVVGADPAGSESVNGIASDHYRFDQHALGQQGFTESSGELWVATDGGYVVKYLLTSKGGEDFFGDGLEGTISYDYELTDVNNPVEITLPDDCPLGLVDAPLLPDASNVQNGGGVLAFDTASSISEAAAFYEQQIPPLGWEAQDEPSVTENSGFLAFSRGNRNLLILIITGEAGRQVRIMEIQVDPEIQ
jgi:hypothetical protein